MKKKDCTEALPDKLIINQYGYEYTLVRCESSTRVDNYGKYSFPPPCCMGNLHYALCKCKKLTYYKRHKIKKEDE